MSKLYKGIDVSLYDGDPDFAKARDAGIDFVIIKASQGSMPGYPYPFADPCFKKNMKRFAATPGKIYAGAYHYLTATTVAASVKEADFFIETIKPYKADLQLWAAVDVEDTVHKSMTKAELTAVVAAFCERVKAAGFRPMVYSSTWWFDNRFTAPSCAAIWEANWSRKSIPPRARAWQFGSTRVAGFPKDVDGNYAVDIMGDANGDGKVSASDVTAAMKYLIKKKGTKIDERQLDFDRDGKVTAKDVLALMKALI